MMSMPRGLIDPFPDTLQNRILDACHLIHHDLFIAEVLIRKHSTHRGFNPGIVDIAQSLRENIKKADLGIDIDDIVLLAQDINHGAMIGNEWGGWGTIITCDRIEVGLRKLLSVLEITHKNLEESDH
ncbi:MAG: hypothetical protein M0Q91_14400 [Methanoregula sp.]|jgi:hypothetical protein|nr:hypothetical protein [Methanoregula sp.]